MLRHAAAEIRLHPSRFVATLLAIAISVGFIVAISTAVNTESEALGRANALPISRADVVVTGHFAEGADVVGALEGVDGVAAAGPADVGSFLLSLGERSAFVNVLRVPAEPLRWAELSEGRWPTGPSELALSRDGMAKLGARLGDQVSLGGEGSPTATVVGVTDDARSLYSVTGYGSSDLVGDPNVANSFAIRLDDAHRDGAALADAIRRVQEALPASAEGSEPSVTSGQAARDAALKELTGDVEVFKYLLYAFAAVALLVGMIIIANTFTILVAQRRRQIGLLRAVGASTAQVRGRVVAEALLLGLIGSALGVALGVGVAALAAYFTGALFWGLVLQPLELGVAVAVGVGATLVSALGPSLAATRVRPIEALQAVPTAQQARRAGVARGVLCAVLALAGAALIAYSYVDAKWALVWAILAGALLSVAVLVGAALWVGPVLGGLGRLLGFVGPTTRLAAQNAARNPRRAAATTVALMLAVGLVVTLQVALSTVRTTGVAAIDEKFPNDMVARSTTALGEDYIARVSAVDGVEQAATVQSKSIDLETGPLQVRDTNSARAAMGLPDRLDVPDGVIVVSEYRAEEFGDELTLDGASGPVTLKVRSAQEVPYETAAVSRATFDRLAGEPATTEIWVKLTDRTSMTIINRVMKVMEANPDGVSVEGGAVMAGMLDQVLGVILLVLSALLGVAVVIALVGVGNTLGLSVIERQRESALLRALGMQRAGLRGMLLVEALLLAVLGTVVGVAAGAFFGWLGVTSMMRMNAGELDIPIRFSLDPGLTAALIGVCILAAALASVLPGRRAANATPTEALAVD